MLYLKVKGSYPWSVHYNEWLPSPKIYKDIDDIYVDERSIKHVIIALINYAMEDRKRGRKDSFVKIIAKSITKEEQQFLQLIFEDNGHGISEEMRMNFQQTAEKEGKNGSNVSLSLNAIKAIVASHKSTLQINNISGKGSIITIEIPYFVGVEKNELNKSNIVELFPKV